MRAQRIGQRAVEVLARAKPPMVENFRCDTVAARAFEPARRGLVGDHDANLGLEFTALDGVDDRLQVGALTGDQNAEFHGRPRVSSNSVVIWSAVIPA